MGSHRFLAILLAAASLSAPIAAAGPIEDRVDSLEKYTGKDIKPNEETLFLPCAELDARIDVPLAPDVHYVLYTQPDSCGVRYDVNVTWNATSMSGHGELELRIDTLEAPAPPESPLTGFRVLSAGEPEVLDASVPAAILRWLGLPPALPAPTAPVTLSSETSENDTSRPLVVRAKFDVEWGLTDCSDSRGTFEASVNGVLVSTDEPPGLFRSLCVLSRSEPPVPAGPDAPEGDTIGAQAAQVAASVLTEVSRSSPEAGLEPAIQALDALATARPADAPPAPRAPAAQTPSLSAPTVAPPGVSVSPAEDADPSASGEALLMIDPRERDVEAQGDGQLSAGVQVQGNAVIDVAADPVPSDVARAGPAAAVVPDVDGSLPEETREDAAPAPDVAAPPFFESEQTAKRDLTFPPRGGERVQTVEVLAQPPPPDALVETAAVLGLLALVGLALYQRLRRPIALQHPVRKALSEACLASPRGATAEELGQKTGVSRQNAEYHLRYLTRLGLLRASTDEKARWIYASPGAAVPAPREPLADRMVEAVRARPGATLSDLARLLAVTKPRADRCAKDLLLTGRLEARWREGGRSYFIRADLAVG